MSIWRNQPLEHIIVTKPFTTLEKKKILYQAYCKIIRTIFLSQ